MADSCWNWKGYTAPNGYGFISAKTGDKSLPTPAHRIAYLLFHGAIPEGLWIDHICRNRRCVNPLHLEAVTPQVNTLRGDGPSAKAATRTHCDHGHEFTAENTYFSQGYRHCRLCLAISREKHRPRSIERKRQQRALKALQCNRPDKLPAAKKRGKS